MGACIILEHQLLLQHILVASLLSNSASSRPSLHKAVGRPSSLLKKPCQMRLTLTLFEFQTNQNSLCYPKQATSFQHHQTNYAPVPINCYLFFPSLLIPHPRLKKVKLFRTILISRFWEPQGFHSWVSRDHFFQLGFYCYFSYYQEPYLALLRGLAQKMKSNAYHPCPQLLNLTVYHIIPINQFNH